MVLPIDIKSSVSPVRTVANATPVGKVERASASQASAPVVQSEASGLTREMAASPPIDSERVAEIRRAVQNGTFPLVPTTIADRLLALKLNWNPHE